MRGRFFVASAYTAKYSVAASQMPVKWKKMWSFTEVGALGKQPGSSAWLMQLLLATYVGGLKFTP